MSFQKLLKFPKAISYSTRLLSNTIVIKTSKQPVFISPKFCLQQSLCRNLSTTNNQCSIIKKVFSKIPFLNIERSRLQANAFFLYESVADKISYRDFFERFSLEDSFYSWFVITELHVWMLLVRAMAEGDDGRYTRNCIVQALWNDVNARVKRLAPENPAGIRNHLGLLSQQFQAALFGYDEGLQSNDKILAAALWRRFFQHKCDNPEELEALVKYIRIQIKYLDNLSREQFFEKHQVIWEPLDK